MVAHTENVIVINAPIDFTWKATNDLENWPNLFTEYAKIDVLERRGNSVVFRLTMHPDEQGNAWSWVSERTLDPDTRTARAHRIETGWFKYMHIFWEYHEADGGTRTQMRWVQDFEMKPNAPVNDEQMRQRIDDNSKIQMRAIKERVEQMAAQR